MSLEITQTPVAIFGPLLLFVFHVQQPHLSTLQRASLVFLELAYQTATGGQEFPLLSL